MIILLQLKIFFGFLRFFHRIYRGTADFKDGRRLFLYLNLKQIFFYYDHLSTSGYKSDYNVDNNVDEMCFKSFEQVFLLLKVAPIFP